MPSLEKIEAFSKDSNFWELVKLTSDFNIFEAIGMSRQEIRHSTFIAFLLNPKERHGFKDSFLRIFIKDALKSDGSAIGLKESTEANVSTEIAMSAGGGRFDIRVIDPVNKYICLIENKVDATESENQLEKYRRDIEKLIAPDADYDGYKPILIFLTKDADLPISETEQGHWICYSYAFLEALLKDFQPTIENKDVALLMGHYENLLRRHVLSKSSESSLCRELWKNHSQALDLIFQHKPEHNELVAKIIHDFLDTHEGLIDCALGSNKEIYFAPSSWEKIEQQTEGSQSKRDNRVVTFCFKNQYPDSLTITFAVGPSNDQDFRKQMIDGITEFLDKTIPNKDNENYHLLHSWIITINDVALSGPRPFEEVIRGKIEEQWEAIVSEYPGLFEKVLEIGLQESSN